MHSNNPLHGITLEMIIVELYNAYGRDRLSKKLNVNCFKSNPSTTSCLKFFRKTPWARAKLEDIYLIYKEELRGKEQQ
ncbi:MAG: VF530 family protein [Sulfurospirillaceae bacterium]|nr:VF530 family protein [Sulfurospirillaceae bacterium]